MRRGKLPLQAFLVAVVLAAGYGQGAPGTGPDTAAVVLTNRASATYEATPPGIFQTFSPTTTLTVAATSGVTVTPDDATLSGIVQTNSTVTRRFTLTNLGNQDDQFRITSATVSTPAALVDLHFDLNGDGIPDSGDLPVVIGTTSSPDLAPGSGIDLLVRYSTAGLPPAILIDIAVTAETLEPGAVNGLSSDNGTIRHQVSGGAVFSNPTNPAGPPVTTVDGEGRINATAGQAILLEGSFANSGTEPATNTVVTVPLASGLSYVPGSLVFDSNPQTDTGDGDAGEVSAGTIVIRPPSVAPGAIHQFAFRARVNTAVAGGKLLATSASFIADSLAPTGSSAALVLVDPFGITFDATTQSPMSGIDLTLLLGSSPSGPLGLPPYFGAGAVPNLDNVNPFASDGAGRFSFLLESSQVGTSGSPETYVLEAARSGFLDRRVEVQIENTGGGGIVPVYDVTLTALDGLPLAENGTFTLASGPVLITEVAAIGFNLPFFPDTPLRIIKTSDRSHAQVGESLGYRVHVSNDGALALTGVSIVDELPEFLDPVEGASRLIRDASSVPIEFMQSGRTLRFDIRSLAPGESLEVSYRTRVAPGAPAAPAQNLALVSGTLPGGLETSAGPARAVVFIRQGIFSFQQVLVGRVFEDLDGNGLFGPDDEPVPGVRVVLDNGMSSTTDSEGLYSLPSVPEGARMIGLDETTYSSVLCPAPADHMGDQGVSRLLRTPVGGGALLQQNFALRAEPDCLDSFAGAGTQLTPTRAFPQTEVQDLREAAPAEPQRPLEAGTYVRPQTEILPPVLPGEVDVIAPADGSSTGNGALDLEVRAHRNGTVRVRVNEVDVGLDRLGQTELDDLNQLATFHFYGIPVRPGPNNVVATASGPDGIPGFAQQLTVYGPGPAVDLRLDSDRPTVPADGTSSARVHVELTDAWGRPAQDSQVRIETSAGWLTSDDTLPGAGEVMVTSSAGFAEATLRAGLAGGPARLRAAYGELADETEVFFLPEERPEILIGMSEMTLSSAPAPSLSGNDPSALGSGFSGRTAFYYKGPAPLGTLLTTAYDSENRLNRTNDTNRLFDLDPLSRLYPVMGDSSTHFQETESNSRVFFKVEKARSSLTWGDFATDFGQTGLVGSSRLLTGLRVHLEEERGDTLTFALAEPGNGFVREVIPAVGLSGFYRLQRVPVVPGTERIILEVHDRTSPELVLSSEPLFRGLDYDLDPLGGTLTFRRPIQSFTSDFDPVEIIALYEVETTNFDGLTWSTRGEKSWEETGTGIGLSVIGEDHTGRDAFHLLGFDWNQRLPQTGDLTFEIARSVGRAPNFISTGPATEPNGGTAIRGEIQRNVRELRGPVRFSFIDVGRGFQNPFGASVTPGMRKFGLDWEPALAETMTLGVSAQQERNQTDNVDNSRTTGSIETRTQITEEFLLLGGYGHRAFRDRTSNRQIGSNLVSAGFEYRPTPRWNLSVKREQNVTANSDPSYPDSTFLSVGFQQNEKLLYFARARDSSRAVEAIADVTAAGLTPRRSASELQFGAESRLGNYSTLTSRYQLENGVNGLDSFSVVGLGSRVPLNEEFALDFKGEAGLHMAGQGNSFQSFTTGVSWLPEEDFRTTVRYEFRNAGGFGQTLSANIVGQVGGDVTLLARLAASNASQKGRDTRTLSFLGGAALRPLGHDRFGLFLHWSRKDRSQGPSGLTDVRVRTDTVSADSVFQLASRVRYFLKTALAFTEDKPDGLPSVATTTTLLQNRLEYRIGRRWDVTSEFRSVYLWQDDLTRNHLGIETGFWLNPGMRIGLGYGVAGTRAVEGERAVRRGGVYLNLTSSANPILDMLRGAL